MIFIDVAALDDCLNEDSYGEICVKCNKCGRFDNEDNVIIEKDSIFYCRDCGKDIYKVNRNIEKYDEILHNYFEGIGEVTNPKNGTKIECCFCKKELDIKDKMNYRKEKRG